MSDTAPETAGSEVQVLRDFSGAPRALASFVAAGQFGELDTRAGILAKKHDIRTARQEAAGDARGMRSAPSERSRLYRVVQDCLLEEQHLESLLDSQFVPQHGPRQLISPRAFFVSPLFRVCSKRVQREELMKLEITAASGARVLQYRGPELRQSDGLTFMALLNLVRDVQVGTPVKFFPEDLCHAVFRRYDGPTRKLLREHIQRLQQALLMFEQFSVQLCMRFDYPANGQWAVVIDPDIVALFSHSAHVWLDFEMRQSLPEGLATWLYAFVESQSRLIPIAVGTLRSLCGSDATEKSFTKILREALTELAARGVIDAGWSTTKQVVRWRKTIPAAVSAKAPARAVVAGSTSTCSDNEAVIG